MGRVAWRTLGLSGALPSASQAPFQFNRAADRAMAALKDTRALIVDVRRNGGGSRRVSAAQRRPRATCFANRSSAAASSFGRDSCGV